MIRQEKSPFDFDFCIILTQFHITVILYQAHPMPATRFLKRRLVSVDVSCISTTQTEACMYVSICAKLHDSYIISFSYDVLAQMCIKIRGCIVKVVS